MVTITARMSWPLSGYREGESAENAIVSTMRKTQLSASGPEIRESQEKWISAVIRKRQLPAAGAEVAKT